VTVTRAIRPEPVRTIVLVARDTELSVRIDEVRASAHAALRRPANWIQLVKFCVVGVTGYAVNLGVYALLVHVAGIHYLAAAVCSFVVAVTNNYTWNRLWTFRAQRGHVALQGAKFLVVSLAALGANLAALATLVALGMPKVPAQAVAIVIVTPLSFLGNKLWSFR
jgi:dolichol-phosphate mannosyltransferase